MKKLLIIGLIGCFSLVPSISMASPGKHGNKLGLTDEQKIQVKDLKKSLGIEKGNKESWKANKAAFKAGMKEILTPEQQAKAKELKKEHKEKHKGKHHEEDNDESPTELENTN